MTYSQDTGSRVRGIRSRSMVRCCALMRCMMWLQWNMWLQWAPQWNMKMLKMFVEFETLILKTKGISKLARGIIWTGWNTLQKAADWEWSLLFRNSLFGRCGGSWVVSARQVWMFNCRSSKKYFILFYLKFKIWTVVRLIISWVYRYFLVISWGRKQTFRGVLLGFK